MDMMELAGRIEKLKESDREVDAEIDRLRTLLAEEREACARVADEYAGRSPGLANAAAQHIGRLIRARTTTANQGEVRG